MASSLSGLANTTPRNRFRKNYQVLTLMDSSENKDNVEYPISVQLPLKAFMERTASSLGFIQNFLKEETTSAYQIAWGIFLREMMEDLKYVERRMDSQQENVRAKDQLLAENANAYEELQTELEQDKITTIAQLQEIHKKDTKELNARIRSLEAEITETMEMKTDLLDKFNTLFRRHKSSKLRKQQLIQEMEDLAHEVEVQKEMISRLKKALNDSRNEIEEECEKSYKEGYKDGRQVAALEELGVMEQLKILKGMEAALEHSV